MNSKITRAATGLAVASLALSGCAGTSSANDGGGEEALSLVGFSVLEAANKEVTAAFAGSDVGSGAEFLTSYGASGDQSRAIEAGKDADIVHLSLEPDLQRLVDADLVDADWSAGPTKGILSQSVVVFVVRPGNPEGIDSWDDLTKDGIEVITPNPASSGSAKWNMLAAYGQAVEEGGSPAAGAEYLTAMLGNTVALPESARDATTLFDGGTGDVLLSYENEAILAKQNGAEIDYVLPDTTLLIENPGAVTKAAKSEAQEFLDFVVSEEGQGIYAKFGFRPLGEVEAEVEGANDPADPFPAPETLLTITEDFAGWAEANDKYFDENTGLITELLAKTGKE